MASHLNKISVFTYSTPAKLSNRHSLATPVKRSPSAVIGNPDITVLILHQIFNNIKMSPPAWVRERRMCSTVYTR